MTMMMYDMSRQYHAERIMSAAERRRADEQLGRMAARVSRSTSWAARAWVEVRPMRWRLRWGSVKPGAAPS